MTRALFAFIALFALQSFGAIKTETVEYKDGDTTLEGFLAYNDAKLGKSPAVVIVHDWMGVNDYARRRAKEMAELGYIAFAADIYGKGVRPKNQKEASDLATKYKSDRKILRNRVLAAYDTLKKNPKVDTNKMLAMGYCFGGTTALELAMAGVPLKGVASFHGGLDFPTDIGDVKNMKTKLLIMHGGLDPYVPMDQVMTFKKAMDDAKLDYQLIIYSGAVHAFTVPDAGNDPSKGTAYNATADKRSFQAMKDFFHEVIQ